MEPGRRCYKKAKRIPKTKPGIEQKGTILKYISNTMNIRGMGSMEPGSKRKAEVVEDGMVRVEVFGGSYGAQCKKLRLGKDDLTGRGYAKSKTGKNHGNAKKTVIGGGADQPDRRMFWNLSREQVPGELEMGRLSKLEH